MNILSYRYGILSEQSGQVHKKAPADLFQALGFELRQLAETTEPEYPPLAMLGWLCDPHILVSLNLPPIGGMAFKKQGRIRAALRGGMTAN
jgi:hypothetical protein